MYIVTNAVQLVHGEGFRIALENIDIGVKVNGRQIYSLKCADDTALIADTAEELQNLLNAINDVGLQYRLVINVKKTEFMVVSREKNPEVALQINGVHIKRITSFKYLGAMLNVKCDDDEEVHIRVGHAHMGNYAHIWPAEKCQWT